MPRAVITGVSGQTGSYLAELLLGQGWEVHGITNSPDRDNRLDNLFFHEVDIRDTHSISRIIRETDLDAFINLAAVSSVAQSWADPLTTADINSQAVAGILSSIWSLEETRKSKIHFVQASSAEIFGSSATSPQNEKTALAPTNPYGASKAAAQLLTGAYRAAGLKASCAILFNHESPRRPETFVTRKITASVARISLGLQQKMTIGDLSVKRDWGWAPDYARALMLMLTSTDADDYVIATGTSHSIRDFIAKAFSVVGITDWEPLVEVDTTLFRPTDSTEIRGNSSKIRKTLGWAPTKSFDEIISEMVYEDVNKLSQK